MGKINSKEKLIQMMQQYQNLIFSVCLKLTGDYFTAEDLTQETFIAAFRHMEQFDGTAEKAWLCRIASNKCIDYLRAAKRQEVPTSEEELPELPSEQNEPLKAVLNREVLEKLRQDCEELRPPYREVALQHFLEGKSAAEIAKQSEQGLSTIKTQIYRAREMLKKSLGKEMLRE